MNVLQTVHLICAITYIYLAAYIIIKNHRSLLNISCAAVILTFCHWSFSIIFVHDPGASKETASLFYNIGSIAWASYVSVAMWFIVVFIDNKRMLRSRIFYVSLVVPPALVIYGQLTGSIAADYTLQSWGWAFIWSDSFWTYLMNVYYLAFMAWGICLVIRQARRIDDPIRRRQAKIICYTAIVPLALSTTTDIVLPRMGIHAVPNMAPDFTIIWILGVVVAIVKYRMLELTPSLAAERIVSTMSDSLLLVDRDGRITLTNSAAENLLGYEKKEIEGKSIKLIFPDNLRDRQMRLLVEEGGVVNHDFQLVSRDGRMIPVLMSSSVMTGNVGEIVGIACVVRDITKRKKAEELLKEERNRLDRMVRERTADLSESEKKYRLLFSSMNEGVALHSMIFDDDGRPVDYGIIDVNRSYERIIGIDRGDAIGRRASDLYGPGEPPYLELFSRVAGSGEPETFDMYFPPLDMHVHVSAFSPRKGQFATVFSDISERKRSEEALRKKTRALRTLSGCNEAVVRAANEGELLANVCNAIVDKGGYRLAWIGFTENDERRTIKAVAHAQAGCEGGNLEHINATWANTELSSCPVGAVVRTGDYCVSQNIINDPDFVSWRDEALKHGYASCAGIPLVDGINVFGVLAIYASEENAFDTDELELLLEMAGNVSYGIKALRTGEEKRIAEDEKERFRSQLVQADKMTTVGQLASGVAHEINNPAAFIISNLEILGKHHELVGEILGMYKEKRPGREIERFWRINEVDSVLDDMANILAECQEGMERIKGTTMELRHFSRVDDEMASSVQLQDLLESSLTIASNAIKYKAKVVKHYSDIPEIAVNRGKISQVFLNILVNAAQAIAEGHVEDNWIRVETRRLGDWIHVGIANSGEPISAGDMSRIFDPFFTTKPQGQGTGLGLSICYSIVHQHGGFIEVDSNADEGTCFHIYLPISTGLKTVKQSEQRVVPPANRPARILVIDDEEGILNSARRLLRRHEVVTACGGEMALDIITQRQDFDVVLCDLMMPQVSGMEVYARVSREHPLLAKRFVFLTGGAFTRLARDFISKVENQKYEKPLDGEIVQKIIDEAVHGVDENIKKVS